MMTAVTMKMINVVNMVLEHSVIFTVFAFIFRES